ncbi:hypothetical protein NNO_2121 [Hydrogenimonas sp.]|nr:hypothetical protein NNO_2121 [Hydrogenimonas sp.]
MGILKKLTAAIVLLLLLNIGFVWYGQASFEATVKTLAKSFTEVNATLPYRTPSAENIRRYLEKSGVEEHPYRTLAVQLEGEYRNKPSSKWAKMHALALLRPSADMMWAIRLESNPVVKFNALETYHGGHASMQMLLFGIIPTGEIENGLFARSELARVLAYGLYNPALLKLASIEYKRVDESRTEATIHDGNLSATVTFISSPEGDIVEVFSGDRVRPLKGGGLQQAAWRMKILSYGEFDGLRLPKDVVESWVIDGNDLDYSKTVLDSAKRL